MDTNFYTGQKVLCINDHFEVIEPPHYTPLRTPRRGEVLTVNGVEQDFLVFFKYNTIDTYNYWHESSFVPIDENLMETAEIEEKTLVTYN
jgi:hypothetical protein